MSETFMESILSSYHRLLRGILFFMAIAIFLAILIKIGSASVSNGGELSVEMNKEGRILYKYSNFTKSKDKLFSTFLLPSNEWWFDSGIDLEANQQVKIVTTGRAHLAIHKLIESAEKDEKSKVNWTGPEGSEWANLDESAKQLNAKKALLINPGNRIGNIILYMCPMNETANFRDEFIKNRKKFYEKFHPLVNNKVYINDTQGKVRLFLTVNDLLLDFSAEGINNSDMAYKRPNRPHNFDNVKRNNFTDVWFADNIGSFLVNVEISEKKE